MSERYAAWITAIAQDIERGHAKEPVDQHLMRHATADLLKYLTTPGLDLRRWSASMHNMLALFDEMYFDRPITVEEKMQRLQEWNTKHPDQATPAPEEMFV